MTIEQKRKRLISKLAQTAKGKITQKQIADKSGMRRENVCRMLKGNSMTLDNFIAIADAIGYDVTLTNQ